MQREPQAERRLARPQSPYVIRWPRANGKERTVDTTRPIPMREGVGALGGNPSRLARPSDQPTFWAERKPPRLPRAACAFLISESRRAIAARPPIQPYAL